MAAVRRRALRCTRWPWQAQSAGRHSSSCTIGACITLQGLLRAVAMVSYAHSLAQLSSTGSCELP